MRTAIRDLYEPILEGWIRRSGVDVERRLQGPPVYVTHTLSTVPAVFKSDSRAAETGNCVVEVWRDVAKGTPGWAVTGDWRLLVYFVAPHRVHVIARSDWDRMVPEWQAARTGTVRTGEQLTSNLYVSERRFARLSRGGGLDVRYDDFHFPVAAPTADQLELFG